MDEHWVVPYRLLCPLTGSMFIDPVTAKDDVNYEREAIETWF